jgi:hypothetical protein
VLPVDVSLIATPDMESRVVIRSVDGDTLNSINHASPRGMNGYYVDIAQWSPDSQFFVYSMVSSGGHSPLSHPTVVYSVERNRFAHLSEMIDGRLLLSEKFQFAGQHELTATTWKRKARRTNRSPSPSTLRRPSTSSSRTKAVSGSVARVSKATPGKGSRISLHSCGLRTRTATTPPAG